MGKLFLILIGKVFPVGNTKLWKIGMNDALPQALPMPRAFRGFLIHPMEKASLMK
jgi:hypothetical protein